MVRQVGIGAVSLQAMALAILAGVAFAGPAQMRAQARQGVERRRQVREAQALEARQASFQVFGKAATQGGGTARRGRRQSQTTLVWKRAQLRPL